MMEHEKNQHLEAPVGVWADIHSIASELSKDQELSETWDKREHPWPQEVLDLFSHIHAAAVRDALFNKQRHIREAKEQERDFVRLNLAQLPDPDHFKAHWKDIDGPESLVPQFFL